MRAQETVTFLSNAAAGTSSTFELHGGRYVLECAATGSGGTLALQGKGPDGATFVTIPPSIGTALTASGAVVYDLPPGQYQVVVTTLSAIYVNVSRVPEE
jgi:hypothetical protein